MFEPDDDGVYLRIYPAPGRRILALGALYALACLLVWLAFSIGFQSVSTILFLVVGAGLLWAAEVMRRSTRHGLELTVDGLRETTGTRIVEWSQVDKVERGIFAMKPSNGFGVKLKGRADRGWAPGLWWRTARRLGVGGVLAPREVRTMGEQMAQLLIKHENGA